MGTRLGVSWPKATSRPPSTSSTKPSRPSGRSPICAITRRSSTTSAAAGGSARAVRARLPRRSEVAARRHGLCASRRGLRRSQARARHTRGACRRGRPTACIRWPVRFSSRSRPAKRSSLLIDKPIDGLAEVFYGLGEALSGEGGVSVGAVYLQIAHLPEARLPVRAGGAGRPLREHQEVRRGHRRLRPDRSGHAAAVGDRHPQGAQSQSARACR